MQFQTLIRNYICKTFHGDFQGEFFNNQEKKYYSSKVLRKSLSKKMFFRIYIFRINNYQKIHTAVLKIAVDAASCVARLTDHQRKFSGQYFYISLNITVILQVL